MSTPPIDVVLPSNAVQVDPTPPVFPNGWQHGGELDSTWDQVRNKRMKPDGTIITTSLRNKQKVIS